MGTHAEDDYRRPPGNYVDGGAGQFTGRKLAEELNRQRVSPETPAVSPFYSKVSEKVSGIITSQWLHPSPEAMKFANLINARAQHPAQSMLSHVGQEPETSPAAEAEVEQLVEQAFATAAEYLAPMLADANPAPVELLTTSSTDSAVTQAAIKEIEQAFKAFPLADQPGNAPDSSQAPPADEVRMNTAINGVSLISFPSIHEPGTHKFAIWRTAVPDSSPPDHEATDIAGPVLSPEQRNGAIETPAELYGRIAAKVDEMEATSDAPGRFLPQLAQRVRERAKTLGQNLLPPDALANPETRKNELSVVRAGVLEAVYGASVLFDQMQTDPGYNRRQLLEAVTVQDPETEDVVLDAETKAVLRELEAIFTENATDEPPQFKLNGKLVSVLTKPTVFDGIDLQVRLIDPIPEKDHSEHPYDWAAVPGKIQIALVRSPPPNAQHQAAA